MDESRVTYLISPPHGPNVFVLPVLMCLHLSCIGPFCKVTKAEFLYKYFCVTHSLLIKLGYGHWVFFFFVRLFCGWEAKKKTHRREKIWKTIPKREINGAIWNNQWTYPRCHEYLCENNLLDQIFERNFNPSFLHYRLLCDICDS